MAKLQATVPKGAPANALVRVRLPDGTEVNVRIPEGLKEGQEFIFEIDSVGENMANNSGQINVSHTTKTSSRKDQSHKSNKHAKKKNKKSNHASTIQNSKVDKAPSFVTIFFNYYTLVYEMVMNTLSEPQTYQVQQPSNNNNNASSSYVRLLDREIATSVDFCVALCIGIFIGLSIVIGFVGGVLWVTPVGLP